MDLAVPSSKVPFGEYSWSSVKLANSIGKFAEIAVNIKPPGRDYTPFAIDILQKSGEKYLRETKNNLKITSTAQLGLKMSYYE